MKFPTTMTNMHLMSILLLFVIYAVKSSNSLPEKVCDTIFVKKFEEFDLLNDCTVVIGNVVFFPFVDVNFTKTDLDKKVFPLREITGFLMVCSVEHATSVGQFFPNLTVIRGQRLFANYAFIIYESEFTEINLKSLLKISRGSMRVVGSNQRLCMPEIDWESIITNGRVVTVGKNITRSDCNSHINTCHTCSKPGFCWNSKTCQRFDQTFFVTGSRRIPCHSLCLGKCINSTAKGCYVCRDKSELGECVHSCSSLKFFNPDSRRCITSEECIKLGRNIYNKDCVQNCPAGYMVDMSNDMTPMDHICRPCTKKCPKICSDLPDIRAIAQLEAIGIGCTTINGSLEINIVDDVSNLTAELQTYLGDIEEIHGTLKIHRSTPLTSLTFLNKLRLVYGIKNKPSSDSIRIFENQNLQSLFDWRLRGGLKLDVKYGHIQIFNNVMLCESEIEHFKSILSQKNAKDLNFMISNGLKRSCRNENITTFSKVLSHDTVQISWNDSMQNTTNKIGGYLLQYIEIEASEVKEFDENVLYERDTCSSHGWKNVEIKQEDILTPNKNDFPNSTMAYNLGKLSQFTYYAFTIQRYNYNSNDFEANYNFTLSGTSEVNIFQTFMNVPRRVTKFSSIIKTSNSITLQWEILKKEKNATNRILLYVYEKSFENNLMDARDYCNNPIDFDEISVINQKSDGYVSDVDLSEEECCERCCKNLKRGKIYQMNEYTFEETLIQFSRSNLRPDSEKQRGKMKRIPGFKSLYKLEHDRRNYTVTNLNPFTIYVFHIYVCADRCSDYEMLYERTAMDYSFDRVELDPINYDHHSSEFKIRFNEPHSKNGVITSYFIEISEVIEKTRVPLMSTCITRKQHEMNGLEFSLKNVSDGNYVYRIKAISLAQHGPFTDWHHYKISKRLEEQSFVLILLSLLLVLAILVGLSVSYYYRHRIVVILGRQNDTAFLMTEMEPTDFHEISLKHRSFDRLSDISEYDDE